MANAALGCDQYGARINHNSRLLSLFWAVDIVPSPKVKKALTRFFMPYASLSSDHVSRPRNDAGARRRRSLVLTDEGSRHPFRATLPPRVRSDLHDIPAESLWRLTVDDVRGVVSTYVATLAAVLVFIM